MSLVRMATYLFLLALSPAVTFSAELSQGEKDTIYIERLNIVPSIIESAKNKGKLTELNRVADTLESQFISSLNSTRVFQLLEQKMTPDLESEQITAEEFVAPEDKSAAPLRRTVGARFAFRPRIDGFEDSAETVTHRTIGRSSLKRKLFLSVVVLVVDTTNDKILSESPGMQLTRTEEFMGGRTEQNTGSDQLIVAVAREVAQKLSNDIVSLLRPAKILSVTGKQLLINRGSDAGFEKGDLVEIYAAQKTKDDDSGETFLNEMPVGQATITRLDSKQSYANISGDDLGITKGAIVRRIKSAVARRLEAELEPPDPTLPDFKNSTPPDESPGSSEKPLKWK